MGFFISVAGGICRAKNGAALREAVSSKEEKRSPLVIGDDYGAPLSFF